MKYDLDSIFEETTQQQMDFFNIAQRIISAKVSQFDPTITVTPTANQAISGKTIPGMPE